MVQARTIGTSFLHGLLMLSLGIALFFLGSMMTSPNLEDFGYTVAVLLTSACLLSAGFISYRGGIWNTKLQHSDTPHYLFAAIISVVCGAFFWISQSAASHIHGWTILTALCGIYWGLWNVGLALHLKDHPHKRSVLCVFAGITSAIGLISATAFQFSDLNAVAALACYTMLIGIQGLAISMYLYPLLSG